MKVVDRLSPSQAGTLLRARRVDLGRTQVEAANRLNISVPTLRAYERAERAIPSDIFILYARWLGMDVLLVWAREGIHGY